MSMNDKLFCFSSHDLIGEFTTKLADLLKAPASNTIYQVSQDCKTLLIKPYLTPRKSVLIVKYYLGVKKHLLLQKLVLLERWSSYGVTSKEPTL